MVGLASVAPQQLEEAVQEHRLEILDKVWPQGCKEVVNTCLWIFQAISIESLLVDLSPAR